MTRGQSNARKIRVFALGPCHDVIGRDTGRTLDARIQLSALAFDATSRPAAIGFGAGIERVTSVTWVM